MWTHLEAFAPMDGGPVPEVGVPLSVILYQERFRDERSYRLEAKERLANSIAGLFLSFIKQLIDWPELGFGLDRREYTDCYLDVLGKWRHILIDEVI